MMTFYLGSEKLEFDRMFQCIRLYMTLEYGSESSNAAGFRAMVIENYNSLPNDYKEAYIIVKENKKRKVVRNNNFKITKKGDK